MEHLNRVCKEAMKRLGVNKTEKGVQRVGKIIGVIDTVLSNYDKSLNISTLSGAHSRATSDTDLSIILKEISIRSQVFDFILKRKHMQFLKIQMNIMNKIDHEELKTWMIMHMNVLVNGF